MFCLIFFVRKSAGSGYRSQRFQIPAVHCQTELESVARAVIIPSLLCSEHMSAVRERRPSPASTLISKAAQICQSLQLFLQPPATAEARLRPRRITSQLANKGISGPTIASLQISPGAVISCDNPLKLLWNVKALLAFTEIKAVRTLLRRKLAAVLHICESTDDSPVHRRCC